MGAGISSSSHHRHSFTSTISNDDERSRSRSYSDSRREQSAFPIEKLRLILFSEEGLRLLLKFISKCTKEGKTINYLSLLSSLHFQPTTNSETYSTFVSSFLSNNSPSCHYLLENIEYSTSLNETSHILSRLESQIPQLIVMIAIGAFPEFLKSEEYEMWCQYEQLIITTTDFQRSNILNTTFDIGMEYLSESHCANFSSIVNRPQWILALAKSFDLLPFPVCIHSARAPHIFLYSNDCFLSSSGYFRDELINNSIDIILSNPFEPTYQYPNLSYQQQYQHFQEYELILHDIRDSFKKGRPSRNLLKMTTKSSRVVYNLMTLVPITNLYGEYTYMISVHCNYQSIMMPNIQYKDLLSSPPKQESKRQEQKSSKNFFDVDLVEQEKTRYVMLLDHFIHCLPYRIHHSKYDYSILVNTYLDEAKQNERNESKLSKIGTTEDLLV